ncbi:MAG TPA: ABC transporter permease, partial [Candidatus Aenigmarchaeota archaeon]|nr:ABC transporter permease [Candidatus Aenigmarchaeota archaeon]
EADRVTVLPGKLSFTFRVGSLSIPQELNYLSTKDVEALRKLPSLSSVAGVLVENLPVEKGGEVFSLRVVGIEPEKWTELYNLGILRGRTLRRGDRYSALLGYSVAYDLFKEDLGVKERVKIGGKEFTVVGIVEHAGGFMSTEDTTVFIPIEVARELMNVEPDEVSMIVVRVKEREDVEEVADEMERVLLKSRRVNEPDFTIVTPSFIQNVVSNLMGMMSTLLGAVATISLIVGGIGIANTMYMTVMEKTREIGVMKAIGAKGRHILLLFLLESGLMGLAGGVLGVIFGYCLGEGYLFFRRAVVSTSQLNETARAVRSFVHAHMSMTPDLILLGLTFSFFVGVFSGLLPARKASELDPIVALRYE